MRRSIVLACTLSALTGSAFAADVGPPAYPAPVYKSPPAPSYNWTGFYLGIDGGYGFGSNPASNTVTDPFTGIGASLPVVVGSLGGINFSGYDVGGHAGYNFQHGIWVAGLELDFSATGVQGGNSGSFIDAAALPFTRVTATASENDKFNYLASVRPRIGVLPLENVLLYATGGLGWSQITASSSVTGVSVTPAVAPAASTATSSTSSVTTRLGWVAGAGVEANLASFGMPNLLVRTEYLFYDFGNGGSSSNSATSGGPPIISSFGLLSLSVVRAGVSFKF
jgi:opacity protein-like surface antigen